MTEIIEQTVLFVDDSPAEIDLYADYFEGDPAISPVTAASAEEGLTRLERSDIDCVVSDGVRTDNGVPLVSVAKQNYPDLPVLLYSGRSLEELPTEIVDDSLQKGTSVDSSSALETLENRIHALTIQPEQPGTPDRNDAAKGWRSLGTFDWEGEFLTATVIEALADRTGQDPMKMEPLYDSVDPEAMEKLMSHAATTGSSVRIQFETSGYLVRTDSDGTVEYKQKRS